MADHYVTVEMRLNVMESHSEGDAQSRVSTALAKAIPEMEKLGVEFKGCDFVACTCEERPCPTT